MSRSGLNAEERQTAENESRLEMERLAGHLKDLILSQPPRDLLGYLWGQLLMSSIYVSTNEDSISNNVASNSQPSYGHSDTLSTIQFVLEYVHAALAAFESPEVSELSESVCAEIIRMSEDLRGAALRYCMFSSLGTEDGVFGPKTGEVEFIAKSNWVSFRGNRYQVLEEEFFNFVLEPHDDGLREVYGAGAAEIAAGLQAAADAMRIGQMRAVEQIEHHRGVAKAFAESRSMALEEAAAAWRDENPESVTASLAAFADLFEGGICNLSKHTTIPPLLLQDLSFNRGENTEFFAEGPLSGTPLRTLPARVKPLIRLDGEVLATDAAFIRDTAYRAIQWNLLNRKSQYREEWNARQKVMSETAFPRVFSRQLQGAVVNHEVWYKDVKSRQWVENDTLIRLDDVLILVEAKAGAAATVASPSLDFERHIRAVQDLVTKAFSQCRRFFEYLNSATEVPLFKREGEKYVEFDRIRFSDYRVAIPIGLTVESFSPFSSMCKELPEIEPILGSYPFVSMSIDDLLVLDRFLPISGELMHYLEVRQSVAGIRSARLYDELDHLGAYIAENRFDLTIKEQMSEGIDLVAWDGFSEKIDQYFSGNNWEVEQPPKQEFPKEVTKLLNALNSSREAGWLRADSHIRDYGDEGRQNLGLMLRQIRESLATQVSRWFQLGDDPPLFIWLQRIGTRLDLETVRLKASASAAAVAANSPNIVAVAAFITPQGDYSRAVLVLIEVPVAGSPRYNDLASEIDRVRGRLSSVAAMVREPTQAAPRRLPGRNEPCWCGSGKKFKKCHGSPA
jgi:hypothetical protein